MNKILLAVVASLSMTACGGGVSAACSKLIACVDKIAPTASASIKATYGAGGTCAAAGAAVAAACDSACTAATASYALQFKDEAACK